MNQEQHEKACQEKFGNPWPEVHFFLDQYFDQFRSMTHRYLLHHKQGVELVVEVFGEEARGPAEQHIELDWGFLPESWVELEKYCCPLSLEEGQAISWEMVRLYPNEYEIDQLG